MNEEVFLSKNIADVNIYKDPDIKLYYYDKVAEVLDNNDKITIVISRNIMH